MSYQQALEAAGAKVLAFENFGSYQGDWWARVRVKGRLGFIGGSFGSCSGCDAFESEFSYSNGDYCGGSYDDGNNHYAHDPACEKCIVKKKIYDENLAAFGAQYLADLITKRQAIKKASENLRWDGDAQSMVDWIKAQK